MNSDLIERWKRTACDTGKSTVVIPYQLAADTLAALSPVLPEDVQKQCQLLRRTAERQAEPENLPIKNHIDSIAADMLERLQRERDQWESDARTAQANWHSACEDIERLQRKADQSRTTSEYWRAEHLAGNERIAELEAQERWIKVSERLPESRKAVAVWVSGTLCIYMANYENGKWVSWTGDYRYWWCDEITHWKPITPPEKSE